MGGVNVGGSPITGVIVAQPNPSAALSFMYGKGRNKGTAGQATEFFVQIVNEFGAYQQLNLLQDVLFVSVSPPAGLDQGTNRDYYRQVTQVRDVCNPLLPLLLSFDAVRVRVRLGRFCAAFWIRLYMGRCVSCPPSSPLRHNTNKEDDEADDDCSSVGVRFPGTECAVFRLPAYSKRSCQHCGMNSQDPGSGSSRAKSLGRVELIQQGLEGDVGPLFSRAVSCVHEM